jgi:hypothetical protein
MKERPILFSGPMACAILEGRKSQTRRAIDPQPDIPNWMNWIEMEPKNGLARFRKVAPDWPDDSRDDIYCRYGQTGDRLWVRETWRLSPDACEGWPTDAKPCPGFIDYRSDNSSLERFAPDFAAIERLTTGRDPDWDWDNPPYAWKSPIHMPRWASRITLEITGIRVERLQNISATDAIAEGIDCPWTPGHPADLDLWRRYPSWVPQAIMKYQNLWDSINADHGHSWKSNPWVWVIEFRRIS